METKNKFYVGKVYNDVDDVPSPPNHKDIEQDFVVVFLIFKRIIKNWNVLFSMEIIYVAEYAFAFDD